MVAWQHPEAIADGSPIEPGPVMSTEYDPPPLLSTEDVLGMSSKLKETSSMWANKESSFSGVDVKVLINIYPDRWQRMIQGLEGSSQANQIITEHNENEFNRLLSEYGTLQQNLEDSKLHHNIDKKETSLIIKKLAILNEKLIKHANIINNDMSNLHVSDHVLKQHITKQQTSLNKYIQELAKQKENMVTVNGMEENTELIRTSNKYYYVMWFFLLITLLALFMYILTSDLVMNTIIVIICLMVIYILAREIHYKYM